MALPAVPITYDEPTQGTGRGRARSSAFAINMRSDKSYFVNRRTDIGFTDPGNPQARFGPSELPVPASKLHVGLFGDSECGRNRRNYLALTTGDYYGAGSLHRFSPIGLTREVEIHL